MIINMTGGGAAKPKLTSIAVTTQPTKTAYNVGDAFSTSGMEVTAYFDDGSSSVVSGYTYSPTTIVVGTNTITISYAHEGITKTTTLTVSGTLWLYNQGTEYSGGITTMRSDMKQADHLYFRSTSDAIRFAYTTAKQDLSKATTLHVETYASWGVGDNAVMGITASINWSDLESGKENWTSYTTCQTAYQSTATSTLSLTSVSGSYYILIYGRSDTHAWQVKKIWIT